MYGYELTRLRTGLNLVQTRNLNMMLVATAGQNLIKDR